MSWLPTRHALYERVVPGTFPEAFLDLLKEVGGSVLDVGCGFASPVIMARPWLDWCIGVDQHAPAIATANANRTHDEALVMDALHILDRFGEDSFDTVISMDLLEHLQPDDGSRFIDQCQAVARRRVILLTPTGFLPQSEYGNNPLQVHRSGWSPRDLRQRGFHVRGVRGARGLRGERGEWRHPSRVWRPISLASQPLVYRLPRLAFQLLAWSDFAGGEGSR